MKIVILALFFTSILCIKHQLRKGEARPFESFTMEDECKIQRCISSDMANNWPKLYGETEGRRRQVECFKNCHMVTCEKKLGEGNYACKLNESGVEYPEDFAYEPLSEEFDDYPNDVRAQEYLKKRNA